MAIVSLGTKTIGSTVKITVNGAAREFIIVQHNKPSAMYDDSFNNSTMLLMKDCYASRIWRNATIGHDYERGPSGEGGAIINIGGTFESGGAPEPPPAEPVILTNLLKNADFSNGTANWNVNAAGTWEVVGDILKGTWISDTAASRFRAYQQFSSTAFPPDHIYYIRASGRMAVWQNQDGTPATGYRQSGIRIETAGGSTKLNSGRNGAAWDSMAQYSAVGNTNPDTTFNLFELDYWFPSFVGTGSTYELKNPMLIDLTEAYGAGNEPTKEWCDENIPFFAGSIEI